MNQKQRPLGSGFTAASTADEVLTGIDLTGKNVVITGGHAGIGLEATRALAEAGAHVVTASRDPGNAARALSGIGNVEADRLDLLDPASIDAFASRVLGTGRPLHILINNAGVPAPDERTVEARGYEVQFAANHLGHFHLTQRLLPALRAAGRARVVNVTSGAQRMSGIRWDDPHFASGYDKNLAYAQSKTANVLFSVELDRRWEQHGIRGYATHPGIVAGTSLNSSAGQEQLRAMGLIDAAGRPVIDPEREKKTPRQGAATLVFAATSPLLDGIGGVYLRNSDISELDDEVRPFDPAHPVSTAMSHSLDPDSARRLWELSEELLKA
ncbi:SDR family NAD(P)-dependent oxidoreductase [Streptomyces sp. NPDC054796]